ncbi:MAG: hypothetical protein ACI8P9_004425 [Parasphingorhabdus sp.]|jgi:hypothetical protein
MHKAKKTFHVNKMSATNIVGPIEWENPQSGVTSTVWTRKKLKGTKVQHFVCHETGIGRVYDSRGPRYYDIGRCKFPAGYTWKIMEKKSCTNTSIQITSISFDSKHNLKDLKFKWWTRSILDHIYRYVPKKGMTNAWKQ